MRFPVSTSLAMTHRLVTEYLEAEARGDALPWTVASAPPAAPSASSCSARAMMAARGTVSASTWPLLQGAT